jgi:hypothetical protein
MLTFRTSHQNQIKINNKKKMNVNMAINPLNKYRNNKYMNDLTPQSNVECYMRASTCLALIEKKVLQGRAFSIEFWCAVGAFAAYINPANDAILVLVRDFLSGPVSSI